MHQNINNLIIEISDTLNQFAQGNLSDNEAKTEYDKLANEYNKIAGRQKSNDAGNPVESLCYFNNTENFSLLSGLYKIENDDIYPLAYYGEDSLNSGVMDEILNNESGISDNNTLKIPANENAGETKILHNIYLYPVLLNKTKKTVFVSVSSSKFFSEEKFLFLAKLLKNIFDVFLNEYKVYENNYFHTTSAEIERFISNNSDEKHSVRIILFVFNIIKQSFNHTGLQSLSGISDQILNTLKTNFKHNAKCFTLSLTDYIILEKIKKNDINKAGQIKIDFSYENNNIPYQTLKLIANPDEPMYNTWNKILIFENYLRTGDILK